MNLRNGLGLRMLKHNEPVQLMPGSSLLFVLVLVLVLVLDSSRVFEDEDEDENEDERQLVL